MNIDYNNDNDNNYNYNIIVSRLIGEELNFSACNNNDTSSSKREQPRLFGIHHKHNNTIEYIYIT